MFCVFQELSSCACKSWFCSMVENLSATTSFITFIKLLLHVRSIAFLGSGKQIKPVTGCKTESKHNLSLFRLGFFFYTILL